MFWLHGIPDWAVSDWCVQFTAHFWHMLLIELNVQACLSLAHLTETNGAMERVNAILEQYLQCFSNQQKDNCAEVLALVEFAYNNS